MGLNSHLEIFNNDEIILSKDFVFVENLESFFYSLIKEKIFVFITKELYNSLDNNIKEDIDETSFEDIQSINGEPPKVTLEDILAKKVVFVKYNKGNEKTEIEPIIQMRKELTQEVFYIKISK